MALDTAAASATVNKKKTRTDRINTERPDSIAVESIRRTKTSTRPTVLKSQLYSPVNESAGEADTSDLISTQPYQTSLERKWEVRKTQMKATRKQKLTNLFKRINDLLEEEAYELSLDLLEEEADELNEDVQI